MAIVIVHLLAVIYLTGSNVFNIIAYKNVCIIMPPSNIGTENLQQHGAYDDKSAQTFAAVSV